MSIRIDMHATADNANSAEQTSSADPGVRCDVAVKRLLRIQLAEMVRHEAGIRRDLDIEHLHRFRIAVRRSRTLLTQVKHTFAPRYERRFKDEFAWLGQATGRARDFDVYNESFEGLADLAGKKHRDALAPLKRYIAEQKIFEHQQLIELLDSPRYQALIQQCDEYLNDPVPRHVAPANAMRPIGEVSREYLATIFIKANRQARELTPETRAEAFHELRKTCKKVRYLFEFFHDLHPQLPSKKLLKSLKLLQQQLGLFQDLQVQQATLRKFTTEMDPAIISGDFEIAFERVLKALKKRETNMRGECIAAWHQFASAADNKALNKLVKKA